MEYAIIANDIELTALDLAAETETTDYAFETASVEIDGKAERAQVLFFPSIGRGGIAWGASADWTEADSIEDVVERYLELNDKEMQN